MSALLGKAGKKLFARHLEQYAPQDPLYEFYTDSKGKKKRRKRELPPGLSARDAKILKSIKRRAHYLDKGFSILGFRFGWSFIIGLIPVVGDVTDASLNYLLVVRKARKADLPPWLVRRMLVNNAVSAGVGFVPVVGDLVLAMFKANSRNAALLEEFLRIRGEEYLKLKEGGESIVATTDGGEGARKDGKKKGISPTDADQIKPGAGIVKGEVVPTEPSMVAPPKSEKKTTTTASGSGKKAFSFFGTGGKSSGGVNENTSKAPPPSGDKGRFVEDVGK